MTMSNTVKNQTNELLPRGCYITLDDTDTDGIDVVGKPIRVVERGQSMYYTVEEAQRLYDALEVALSEVEDDE
jgi:hypothetical protein